MSPYSLKKEDLAQFFGTDNWYKHPLSKKITYTDGVKYVAENGGAYWLLDLIVLGQHVEEVAQEEFQLWVLKVSDNAAILTCDDGDGNIVYRKQIEHTDFPLDEIELWFTNDVILLPSEN